MKELLPEIKESNVELYLGNMLDFFLFLQHTSDTAYSVH